MWCINTICIFSELLDVFVLCWLSLCFCSLSPASWSSQRACRRWSTITRYATPAATVWNRMRFLLSVFSSPFTAGGGGRQSSARLTLRSSSLTVTRLLLLLGKAAAGRERGNGSVFRWPSAGRGKMTEHLQKCHGDFEKDNHALTAFLVLFAETNRRFPEALFSFYGYVRGNLY